MSDLVSTEKTSAPIAAAGLSQQDARELLAAFLEGRCDRTLAAYRADLADFAQSLGLDTEAAAERLLGSGHGPANRIALAYRAHLLERGLSPATVNRRLAALRSLVKLAGTLGFVPWKLEVPSCKSESYRDTRGPGEDPIRAAIAKLTKDGSQLALRDRAMVRLMADLGLRVSSVVSLDLAHVDLDARTVSVQLKGRGAERKTKTLPEETTRALAAWLAERGTEPGAVFVTLDNRTGGSRQRLSVRSVERMVGKLGLGRPHGLRHSAITSAVTEAQAAGIPLPAVLRFSDHANLATLQRYVDNAADAGGELAKLVARRLGEARRGTAAAC